MSADAGNVLLSLRRVLAHLFLSFFAVNRIWIHVGAEVINAITCRSEIVHTTAHCFIGYCYFFDWTSDCSRR